MTSAPTISEIARIANVGTATVDRVLNGRPGVNPETAQRVMQVVAELGASPQPGRPSGKKNFRFAYVLPSDEFLHIDLIERQIAQSAGEFRHQHITEMTHRLDASDPELFAARLSKLDDCDGVALLAPDLPPIKLAINHLVRSGIHVVTIFSDVAGSMRETHIGVDNRASGRTAGLLLARMAQPESRDALLLSSQATRMSAEIERRIGFAQVIEERFPKLRMVRTPDLPADDFGAAQVLRDFLASGIERERVSGIYHVGVGIAGVVQALVDSQLAGSVGVIAHDCIEPHRVMLREGSLSYLLDQDIHYCVLTAARVLRALCENVRGALNVVLPRVEILTAENMI